jgi:hypothetical protein
VVAGNWVAAVFDQFYAKGEIDAVQFSDVGSGTQRRDFGCVVIGGTARTRAGTRVYGVSECALLGHSANICGNADSCGSRYNVCHCAGGFDKPCRNRETRQR